jgi:hypothetical protein
MNDVMRDFTLITARIWKHKNAPIGIYAPCDKRTYRVFRGERPTGFNDVPQRFRSLETAARWIEKSLESH